MADAISDSTRSGTPILEAISNAACVRGAAIAAGTDRPSGAEAALELAVRILTEHGYAPRRVNDTIVMANCPFHALAVSHTELVCSLNHAMLSGFVDAAAPGLLDARLEPGKNGCCVTLTALSG
jgi:predicted ArsR family transcriptional regulator